MTPSANSTLSSCGESSDSPHPPDFALGCIRGRRSEHPFLIQAVTAWRLAHVKINNHVPMFDMKNACVCGDKGRLDEIVNRVSREWDRELLLAYHQRTRLSVQSELDGSRRPGGSTGLVTHTFEISTGVLPGGPISGDLFMDSFYPQI